MSNAVNDLINKAKAWTGYLEKASNASLDDFTANAGNNNFTCFARDYKVHTGYDLQGQPWCAMFVSEDFVQMFGLDKAKKLLAGALYHYCPTGVNQFKAAGRWHTSPEPGDVIFFTNGTRAYHTGIVIEVTSTKIKTIEGNTSGASGVIENGGGVCQKSYSLSYERIMGYGRPDWSIVIQARYTPGWNQDANGWYFADTKTTYYKSCFKTIDDHKYYFGSDGYAYQSKWLQSGNDWYYFDENCNMICNDWEEVGGKWYWFNASGVMVTNTWYEYDGAWYYLGSEGAMCKSQLVENSGKIYAVDADGKMVTGEILVSSLSDGALEYKGLAG